MKALIFVFLLIAAFHSQASVTYGQDFTSAGISSFVYETPYVSEEVENTWSPFIALQYKNFFIRDMELGYQFLTTYDYGAAVSLSGDELSKQRKGSSDAVNDGFNIKGSFSLYRQSGIYTLSAMQDISDVHGGNESTLSWLYSVRHSHLTWYPNIYASWMNAKLVEHYFSEDQDTVMADAYKPSAGWRYGLGVTVDYHPTQHWLFQTVVTNERYSAEIINSPIVERSNAWLLAVNLGYYF